MFQRILVPLDGTAVSEEALVPARSIARATGGQILLARAVEARSPHGHSAFEQQVREVREAEAYVSELAGQLASDSIQTEPIVLVNEPSGAIAEEAAFRRADLIVMATHGRHGVDALLHPSVARRVLDRTTAPVLVWPAAHMKGAAAADMFAESERPILVPLDGSALAEVALTYAMDFATLFRKPLAIMRAADPLFAAVPQTYLASTSGVVLAPPVDEREEARSYLADISMQLATRNVKFVETWSPEGAAAPSILQTATAARADLIVMASHGRSGITRILLGSVTQDVLRQTHLPILVARVGKHDQA